MLMKSRSTQSRAMDVARAIKSFEGVDPSRDGE